MKGIFVVLGGASDEKLQELGQVTPLQAARTPHLDFFASHGQVDHCHPVSPGVAPESSSALLSLFGYEPRQVSRGALEALGAGVPLARGDLAFRTNFATVEDITTRALLDRRAGRTLTTKEANILAKAVNEGVKLQFPFEFIPTTHHKGVLVFRGGFSDNITNVDPDYGKKDGGVRSGKVRFSKPLDDEADSRLAATLLNSFVTQSHEVLDKHPLNITRARRGLHSANFILCRGGGSNPARLPKLKGKWRALAYAPLEVGVARAAKMEVSTFHYPSLKGGDVYPHLYTGLKKGIKKSIHMLKKYENTHDYFFIHIKELDIAGHDGRGKDKVAMLELIDRRLFSFLERFVQRTPVRVVVTSDHTTSSKTKAHTAHPVPVLFYSGTNTSHSKRFTEEEGLRGKDILGRTLLAETLFS